MNIAGISEVDPALRKATPKPLHKAKARRKNYKVIELPPAKAKGRAPRQRIRPIERKPIMGDSVFNDTEGRMWLEAGRRN